MKLYYIEGRDKHFYKNCPTLRKEKEELKGWEKLGVKISIKTEERKGISSNIICPDCNYRMQNGG